MRNSVAASLVFLQLTLVTVAPATEICPTPTFPACNKARTDVVLEVAHSDFRAGFAEGTYLVNGDYGEGTTTIVQDQRLFSVTHAARSSEYVETTGAAYTLDSSMGAFADSKVDLRTGTLRGQLYGYDTALFPSSLFEISQGRVDLALRETIIYHLPAGFAGGNAIGRMTLHGEILDARPSRLFGPTEVYAQVLMGMGAGSLDFGRWNNVQVINDVLEVEFALPARGAVGASLPVNLEGFLRLSSGDGDGGYGIDFFNTATMSIDVPDGVTWESESGLFLTSVTEPPPPSAVPAPSVALLLGVGAGFFVRVRRRRPARS